ncbi:hypothetical protein Bca101_026503 [Brassica carinata]
MSSRSRSSKRNSSSHSSSGDSLVDEVVAPKHEEEVDEDTREAYYKAVCGSCPPPRDIPIPGRPQRAPGAPFSPSRVSPEYLTTLRNFYQDCRAYSCRSFRQTRPSPGKAILLEYFFRRADSKCGGTPSIPSRLSAFRRFVRRRADCCFACSETDIGLGKAKRSNVRRPRKIVCH